MKILFSWVGHADLLGFAGEHSENKEEVCSLVKKQESAAAGPVKITVSQKNFDRVILLWNYIFGWLDGRHRRSSGR